MDSGVLNKFTPSQLAAQAQQFNLTLDVVQGAVGQEQLVIPEDMKELRSVLKFLEEEFYIGVITGVPYETNSKRSGSHTSSFARENAPTREGAGANALRRPAWASRA